MLFNSYFTKLWTAFPSAWSEDFCSTFTYKDDVLFIWSKLGPREICVLLKRAGSPYFCLHTTDHNIIMVKKHITHNSGTCYSAYSNCLRSVVGAGYKVSFFKLLIDGVQGKCSLRTGYSTAARWEVHSTSSKAISPGQCLGDDTELDSSLSWSSRSIPMFLLHIKAVDKDVT